MTSPGLKWDGAVSLGTVIHIGVLIVGLSLAWGAFSQRLHDIEVQHAMLAHRIEKIDASTARMEMYMLHHDPDYINLMPRPGAGYTDPMDPPNDPPAVKK
jgi:hypothetical protein